jgi:acyl carrier protein
MLHWSAVPASGLAVQARSTETRMPMQTAAEHELAILIVDALNLEKIDPQAPLFGGDLGLDSIDALEIALAVSKRYGMQLRSDHPDNQRIFSSLHALSEHVERERTV